MNDDPRPKWWTIAVSIIFLAMGTIMVVLFFALPDKVYLDGETITDDHQEAVFRSLARSDACGCTLVLVICFIMLRTQELVVIKVCNIFLMVWLVLEHVILVVELLTYGHMTFSIGYVLNFLDLLLMLYMLIRLRNYPSEGGEDTTSLLA